MPPPKQEKVETLPRSFQEASEKVEKPPSAYPPGFDPSTSAACARRPSHASALLAAAKDTPSPAPPKPGSALARARQSQTRSDAAALRGSLLVGRSDSSAQPAQLTAAERAARARY